MDPLNRNSSPHTLSTMAASTENQSPREDIPEEGDHQVSPKQLKNNPSILPGPIVNKENQGKILLNESNKKKVKFSEIDETRLFNNPDPFKDDQEFAVQAIRQLDQKNDTALLKAINFLIVRTTQAMASGSEQHALAVETKNLMNLIAGLEKGDESLISALAAASANRLINSSPGKDVNVSDSAECDQSMDDFFNKMIGIQNDSVCIQLADETDPSPKK